MSLESVFRLSLFMNLIDNITGPSGRIRSDLDETTSRLDRMTQTFGNMAKTGAVMQEMGLQITGAVLAPVEATFETRRALGELASLGVEDLSAVESAARSFSDQWAGTSKADFISASYDIKSGIASLSDEGIASFTELSALTGKATKSSVGEMTSLFATGYGIYKNYYDDLTDVQFGEMFSAGISESVRAFKTSGSGMAQSIQSLGASATTANVPLEEQLAVLGMLQATMGGAEAGTKYKAFLRSATKGGEALGLNFMDANNQLLSMPEILNILRGKFGETMDAAEKMELQKAFGDTEAVALIDLMYSKTGDLQDNILGLYDAMGQGTTVAHDMAMAMQETEPERYERLQQRMQNIKESIGTSLLPAVNDLMTAGEKLLTKIGTWIEENQTLVRILMTIALTIGLVLTVVGTAMVIIGGVGLLVTKTIAGLKMLKAGFLLAKGALLPLIASFKAFAITLFANPITWIVIGIVALIAGIVLLYNKCEWFRNLVDSMFEAIKTAAGAAFEFLQNIFGNMRAAFEAHGGGLQGIVAAAIEGIKGIWNAGFAFIDSLTGGKLSAIRDKFINIVTSIRQGVSERFTAVREAFSQGIETIKSAVSGAVTWFFSSGRRLITTFADGIKSAINVPVQAVKGGLQRIRNMLPFSDAKDGPLSTLTLSGQRTMTTYAQGIQRAQDAPAEAVGYSLEQTKATLTRPPAKISRETDAGQSQDSSTNGGGNRPVIIQNLNIPNDMKTIKDLQHLLAILREVESYDNANGGELEPAPV